ncbi:MAG: hybrid sensor histidine kinase/response regulator, partial [Flavisolibacter sp.]
ENTNASTIIFSARPLLWSQHEILLEFVVQDNGPGKRTKGFSFYRSMVNAKKLINELNGKSELISISGGNTTFKFIIKCQHKEEVEKNVENDRYKDSLKGKRILIAEDNEINQQMIINILRREGVIVDIASDGKEAIDIFERNDHHDLVIMDLQMPFMDGFQATNYLRKKLKSSIPVIAVSAGATSLEQSQCYELGFDHYISKPFTSAELITQIRRFLLDNYSEEVNSTKIAV